MNNIKGPYILITPGVPDSIYKGLNGGIKILHQASNSAEGKKDFISGCIAAVEEWPLPDEFMMNLSEKTVIIWNPEGQKLTTHKKRQLILGELGSDDAQNSLILSLFSKNIYQKALISREKVLLTSEREINKQLLKVGVSLSAERNNDKLLDQIVLQIRQLTKSDAGSLYLLVEDEESGERSLLFKIAHNDSNPTDFTEFKMPLNTSSIAGYVAETGEILDIPDVYDLDEDGEIKFNKSYDEATGYRTKSSLTVPMADHQGNVIGVIQLLNKKRDMNTKLKTPEDVEAQVLEYDKHNEAIVLSLASQAAVSLENNRLYNEIQTLFEGFVRASVKAIESRDPSTSGHSNRVALFTVKLAEAVSRQSTGEFAHVHFSDEELLELRYASLLHDFGKVGVREAVLVKAKKLYPGQLEVIKSRLHQICAMVHHQNLQKQFDYLKNEGPEKYAAKEAEFKAEEKQHSDMIETFLTQVEEANEPRFLEGDIAGVLEVMGDTFYTDCDGKEQPYLTPEEIRLLSIPRGSLNREERGEIESHVEHSYDFLSQIPWSRDMKNVPRISKSHHEVLTGKGYPSGLIGDEIPLQSQLMTIADIFDALTASDRPYKKAIPRDRAMSILHEESAAGKINPELLRIFEDNDIYTLEI
ncbi:MAG: GAF domain-containing protein [Spirochaetales bacterium]|nr:GAF domain-containing protein [Spirochaetales bacterium]